MSKIAEKFDGKTYDAKRDETRLSVQLDLVRSFMIGHPGFHTLDEIATDVGLKSGVTPSTASVSARLRDLRKSKFGSYVINRRLRAKALFEYQLAFPGQKPDVSPLARTALACCAGLIVAGIYFGLMLRPAFGRDVGQWENSDPVISEWYRGLKQPDNPEISCYGEADAYWADSVVVDANGNAVAIITDERDDKPLGRPHIPNGTRVIVPKHKLKWDRGNPTGHGVIFINSMGEVLCYVQPGGV